MANAKNLIPNSERTPEQLREMASAGGKASEAADVYLSLPVSDRQRWNRIASCGVDPEDVDNQMAMIIGLTEAATMGDARAAKVIIDLIGEEDSQGEAGVEIIDDL